MHSLRKSNKELLEALEGILDIGKRDMTNPKYDGYFESARIAVQNAKESYGGTVQTTCEPQRRYKPEHNGESNPRRCVR